MAQSSTSLVPELVPGGEACPVPRAAPASPPPPPIRRLAPPVRRSDRYNVDTAHAETIDRLMHAWQARFTTSVSPVTLALAYSDWAMHLMNSPGKQAVLVEKAARKWVRLLLHAGRTLTEPEEPPCIIPLQNDHRFEGEAWQRLPFKFIYQTFLLNQQWWHNATTGLRGVSRQNENIVAFTARQLLDTVSPTNFFWTNPEVIEKTVTEGGQNLGRGLMNALADWERNVAGRPPAGMENFRLGENIAVTPGKVVLRNDLMELIQYEPATEKVHPEPILIVPAWIMKYYILDLSPENSLIRYLVESGFTVFAISWRNPGPEHRDYGMGDYRRRGIMAALSAIGSIRPATKIHACGYCLGGTLLAIAAAALARDQEERLATVTLLAAETDFTEAGELMLFTSEDQVAYLEDTMWEQGYLDTRQMAGAFQMLRSADLIWSQGVRQYLMGERPPMTDLMAWNADTTRMPYKMHSEYLRRCFIQNDIAEGRYQVDGRAIALTDIHVPIFTVATRTDHVAPWHSVYKIHILTEAPITFVLTAGGHNAGIVSEPGHRNRSYQIGFRPHDGHYIAPEAWAAATPLREGSWWPAWTEWLRQNSCPPVEPPPIGDAINGYPPLDDAPGTYVFET